MSRLTLFILLVINLSTLTAAPVGNTAAPELIQVGFFSSARSNSSMSCRMGYEGDFVSNARLDQKVEGSGRVDLFEQWTNSGTLTLNILNRLDLYGSFGSSNLKTNWRSENSQNVTVERFELKTGDHFLWATGGRAILYQWYDTCLGFGGSYGKCRYTPDEIKRDGNIQAIGSSHIEYKQWQLHMDLSYTVYLFTPYIGTKYSRVKADLRDFSTPISSSQQMSNTFENRHSIGLFLGCGISSGNYFMFNIEGRLIDEEGVTVTGDFRF